MRQLCVHRDMKHLGSLESTQGTLTHLSCSPNFPRASYLDERMNQLLTNLRNKEY